MRTCTIAEYESTVSTTQLCPHCKTGTLKRKFSFSTAPIFHEHFNPSVGKVVSSRQQHADELKRASEEASNRTGIEHRFVPFDHRDPDVANKMGVTEQGLDSTERRIKETGVDHRKFGVDGRPIL